MSEQLDSRLRDKPSPDAPGEPAGKRIDALLADQRSRWRRNERIPIEAYLPEHSWLQSHDEALLDLIFQEIVLREQLGEAPKVEEYADRFPRLAQSLEMQFEVDRALQQDLTELESAENGEHGPSWTGTKETEAPASGESAPDLANQISGFERIRELGRGGMS